MQTHAEQAVYRFPCSIYYTFQDAQVRYRHVRNILSLARLGWPSHYSLFIIRNLYRLEKVSKEVGADVYMYFATCM